MEPLRKCWPSPPPYSPGKMDAEKIVRALATQIWHAIEGARSKDVPIIEAELASVQALLESLPDVNEYLDEWADCDDTIRFRNALAQFEAAGKERT